MRKPLFLVMLCLLAVAIPVGSQSRAFTVKYVSSDVVYIEGGSSSGLKEGMRLAIKRPGPGESPLMARAIADLVVISVASTSAACEIVRADSPVQAGDSAFVDSKDLVAQLTSSSETPVFAQVVEFKDTDPLEEELRENMPKPPLREVNRFGGRIGFDQDSIFDRSGSGLNSHQQGVTFRFDFTRIGDSHWNLDGYWRARVSSTKMAASNQSLTDVLQRVYHFGLRYDNPEARYVAGIGRLLVPWASSLSTLDGAYLGRKIGRHTTLGVFGGTTPDPTAWNYAPDRQLGGTFINAQSGGFDTARYEGTVGIALSRLQWKPERQFLFAENGILIGRKFGLHHNVDADYQSRAAFAASNRVALTRSFLTVRLQPWSRLTFDLNHNYFRVLPTADPRLASVGLLDNILFQGLNAGARLEIPHGVTVYGTAGRSRRSEDQARSWSRMGGAAVRIPRTGLRADARYSHFAGTVAAGRYRSVSLRRESSDRWRFEVEGGDQRFDTLLGSGRSNSWFGTGNIDVFLGRFVLGFRSTRYSGGGQNYDQFRTGLDFRF